MSSKTCPACKRFLTAVFLGLLFGFLCVSLASMGDPTMFDVKNPIFWSILSDRILIGVVIGLAGAYRRHPVFGFRCYPFLRGAILGALVSIPIATGAMLAPTEEYGPWMLFWMTVIAGAVYGLIIDVVATKVGGEGKDLLSEEKK